MSSRRSAWLAAACLLACGDDDAPSTSTVASTTAAGGLGGTGGADPGALIPVALSTHTPITLVLMQNGDVWGYGDNGGDACLGAPPDLSTVTRKCHLSNLSSLFLWGSSASGTRRDGTPVVWGDEGHDQYGDGPQFNASDGQVHAVDPVADVIHFQSASITWAIQRDGQAFYWGDGRFPLIPGENFPAPKDVPTPWTDLPPNTVYMQGNQYACAISAEGDLRVWGRNEAGNNGDGTTVNTLGQVPALPVLRNVKQIAGCWTSNCALTHAGEVYCWGAGRKGQLGDGRSGSVGIDEYAPIQTTPKRVEGLPTIVGIRASPLNGAFCVWSDGGDVFCWGRPIPYPGFGGSLPTTRPKQLANMSDVIDVALGYSHMSLLKRDGTVWSAGDAAVSGRTDWSENKVGQVHFTCPEYPCD